MHRAALAAADAVEAELACAVTDGQRPMAPAWGLAGAAALGEHRRQAFAAVVHPVLSALLAAA